MEELRLWRVYILVPLEPRQRKHTLRFYRVCAISDEAAKEIVQREILDDRSDNKLRIVNVREIGAINTPYYDGMITLTPAEVKERYGA